MNRTTEERLAEVEAKLAEYEALFERLMVLAAGHPMGRQILRWMAREGVSR